MDARSAVAMSIAGSDSGGGAGLQADLQAFSFFAVFGTTVVTAVTAQNPKEVRAVHPVPAGVVKGQIEAILAEFSVHAVKTGMLFNAEIVEAVCAALPPHGALPLVVDPVMVATSGARLLREDAVRVLCRTLLPRATLITPNLPEARLILDAPLEAPSQIALGAQELASRYGNHVLIKGGHDITGDAAVDTLSNGRETWRLRCPRVRAATSHGTGCTLSAAVTARLALGDDMMGAVLRGKAFVYARLTCCAQAGPDVWVMKQPPHLPLDAVVLERV